MKFIVEVSRNITLSGNVELEVSEQEVREYFKETIDNDGNPVLGPDDELDIHEHVEPYVSDTLYGSVCDAAENAEFKEVHDEEWDIGDIWEL